VIAATLKSYVRFVLSVAAATLLMASAAQAQTYPNRAIRIITPFAAGAVSDISLRFVAEKLSAKLGVPVIVDNQQGAGGISAGRQAASAPADGYTLTLLSNATAVSAGLFKKLPFDPRTDFVPVLGISDFEYLFVTNSASPYKSLKDFMTTATAKPGTLNVGTSAAGTSNHLTALLFKTAAKLDFVVVPYRGASELTVALLRNDLELVINAYGGLRQGIEKGDIRVLATSTLARVPLFPDAPTVQELGIAGFDVSSWNGLYAPAKTPPEIVAKLTAAMREVLKEPEMAKRFADLGLTVRPFEPAELDRRMKVEIERWSKVIEEAGIERQ
jgi:tripartite-type tricarboxylate transporter receptor subunit TctC